MLPHVSTGKAPVFIITKQIITNNSIGRISVMMKQNGLPKHSTPRVKVPISQPARVEKKLARIVTRSHDFPYDFKKKTNITKNT